MLLSQLSEVAWRFYQDGKAGVKGQLFRRQDIAQKTKIAVAATIRRTLYASKKMEDSGLADESFIDPMLATLDFELGEPDTNGKRRADMTDHDLYRMPNNSHFKTIRPVDDGCGVSLDVVTLVSSGEANFYIGNPAMKSFRFAVVKGRGLDTYNLPPCVKKIEVEATYDIGDDTDISMDIAFDAANYVLGTALKVIDVTAASQLKIKAELEKMEAIK